MTKTIAPRSVVPYAATATRHFPAGRPILPEWARSAWASVDEQGWWKPYLDDVTAARNELERWSVVRGIRNAAWILVAPNDLPGVTSWAASHGLVAQARERVGTGGTYMSSGVPFVDGRPWLYRVLLLRPECLAQATVLDDDSLGELLGYPKCCRDFYRRTWASGQVDSTWDQIAGDADAAVTADGPAGTNQFWRWLGIRWVSHLPCSLACHATVEIATQVKDLAISLGYREEASTIDTVLNWPLKWSAVNGIAEIVGPCVKVSARTDWSPLRRVVTRQGAYTRPETWLWADNGFKGAEAMYRAHKVMATALAEHLPPGRVRVTDLGCGNGLLLKRARLRRAGISISGVDINGTAIGHARADLVGTWREGRIQDVDWEAGHPDAVVISPRRLTEMSVDDRARVKAAVLAVPNVFVYAYDDCLQKFGSLPALCLETLGLAPATIAADASLQFGVIRHVA